MLPVLFLIIATLGVLASLGVVLARNLVHAGLYLVAFFFLVACLFVLLEAEFMAAIQVLIYIGAVAILLMFGIMLTRNIQGDDTTIARGAALIPATIVGVGLIFVLCLGISDHKGTKARPAWSSIQSRTPPVDAPNEPGYGRTVAINDMGKAVGIEMMTRFLVPFEVAGLLLTAALVGAITLARNDRNDSPVRTGAIATVDAGSSGRSEEVMLTGAPR